MAPKSSAAGAQPPAGALRRANLLLVCLLAAPPGVAVAQSASRGDASGIVEEVVVTAQRRARDLQDTAMSASVLTGDMLEAMGVNDLYQIQHAVPSVTIGNYGSANEFNIRGIGRNQVDIDVPSGVVIYRDGAPTIAGYFQGEPYFDIQSIEVLRGPQGTFVGKSAAGGAVFINTSDADPSQSSGRVQAGFGNHDRREITAVFNQPLSDELAVRVAANLLDTDHYYDAITGDYEGHPGERDLKSVRTSVLWQPSPSFTAKVKVDYHDLDFGGNVVSSPGFPLYDVEQNGLIQYQDESLRVVGDLSYTFANGVKVRSLTAYQDLDSVNNLDLNASQPGFYQFMSNFEVDIKSQEIDIISPDDARIRWVAGALYFEQDAVVPPWQEDGFTFTGGGFGTDFPWLTSPWDKHEDEWSVFAHLAFDLTDSLELEVGARYSDYYTDQFTEWVIGDGTAPPSAVFAPAGTQELSEDSVDGQVALNWSASDDHFLYGVISRGHVTGGINIFPPFRVYDEMSVVNYEIGWKANWAGNQVKTQATLYRQDFDDFIVNFEQQAAFGAPGQDNRNAPGTSTIWGIETSLQAMVGNWQIDANFAWMDSDIGSFRGVVDPIATGQNGGVPVVVDLTGNRTPYSPEVTASAGLAYRFRFGGGYSLTPRLDVAYVDETRTKLWDSPLVELESRTLTNAQLALLSPDARWSATVWVTNLFDEKYVSGIQNLASLLYAGRPREYGLRMSFNF